MAGRWRAGYTGQVKAGGAAALINLREWSTTYTGQALETTNFESNGAYEGIVGIGKVEWSVKGNWDSSAPPYSDPPGLYPRDDGSNLALILSSLDAATWTLPKFICNDSKIGVTVDGLVTFEASGSSNGSFTPPSGGAVPPLP